MLVRQRVEPDSEALARFRSNHSLLHESCGPNRSVGRILANWYPKSLLKTAHIGVDIVDSLNLLELVFHKGAFEHAFLVVL